METVVVSSQIPIRQMCDLNEYTIKHYTCFMLSCFIFGKALLVLATTPTMPCLYFHLFFSIES